MAQVPGLGLDQSQLADVINQQYKGYSQKQRNQMMQSAAASPDNWTALTQQSNQQAQQPSEFLGAGRQTDIPRVSQNGEVFAAVSPDQFSEYSSTMPEFGKNEFAPTYENEQAKYYNSKDLSKVNTLAGAYDYLKKINPLRTKTETWDNITAPDLTQGWKEMQGATDEYGNTSPSTWTRQVQDTPLTYTDFMDQYGATPSGGWTDANTKGNGLTALFNKNGRGPLQQWMKDESFLPKFSLLGSGSAEDMQKGFNVLQHMSPQNIGEFWSLSPDVQKGMLANPAAALQQMRATANPANKDWLSVGAEGGLRDISNWEWNNQRGLTTTPGSYMQIHDENNGLLGSFNAFMNKVDPINGAVENAVGKTLGYDNGLDMVRQIGEPVGNLAGAIFSGGIPWGSIVAGADNVSTGNDEALLGNVINGLVSYGGSQVSLGGTGGAPVETAVGSSGAAANSMSGSAGGVFGSGVSLGSTAANQAAQGMLMNAGSNYARTGDLENALKAAAFSTASGAAGNWLGNATQGQLGEIGSKALGGAASGGLNSLFSGNSPVNGSLFGAMSGGLHGFLNSTDRSNKTYNQKQNIDNKNIAQTATNLAKLFVKK